MTVQLFAFLFNIPGLVLISIFSIATIIRRQSLKNDGFIRDEANVLKDIRWLTISTIVHFIFCFLPSQFFIEESVWVLLPIAFSITISLFELFLIASLYSNFNEYWLSLKGKRNFGYVFGLYGESRKEIFSTKISMSPFTSIHESEYHSFREDIPMTEIVKVSNQFERYVYLKKLHDEMPDVDMMNQKEKELYQELKDELQKSLALLQDMKPLLQGAVKATEGESQLTKAEAKVMKKLEGLFEQVEVFKEHIDPALEEVLRIQKDSLLPTDVKDEAKELEIKIREKLLEKQATMATREEHARSNLKAVKMFHGI